MARNHPALPTLRGEGFHVGQGDVVRAHCPAAGSFDLGGIMTEYLKPKTLPNQIDKLPTVEEQTILIEDARALDSANKEVMNALVARYKALRDDMAEFTGYNRLHHRGMDAVRVFYEKPPFSNYRRTWASMFEDRFRDLKTKAESDERKAKEDVRNRHEALKPVRATLFLIRHGMVEGQHFTPENAIGVANEYAFNEAVKAKTAEGGPFSFSGEDNCEDCDGWDGESRRCNCGNRRVSWSTDDDFESFDSGNYYVYGEAY
jgi:hypothetical protein